MSLFARVTDTAAPPLRSADEIVMSPPAAAPRAAEPPVSEAAVTPGSVLISTEMPLATWKVSLLLVAFEVLAADDSVVAVPG